MIYYKSSWHKNSNSFIPVSTTSQFCYFILDEYRSGHKYIIHLLFLTKQYLVSSQILEKARQLNNILWGDI
jgi:hypothetical protein